jgi:hypothetical protein
MKDLEHNIFAWLTLVIVAAVIADLLTNGGTTVQLATIITSFGNSAISAAAGKGTQPVQS